MNPEELQELRGLREEQRRLEGELRGLRERIEAFSVRANAVVLPPLPTSAPAAPPLPPPLPAAHFRPAPEPPLPDQTAPTPPDPLPKPAAPVPPRVPARPRESFELQLGAVWLARIGIVMLITGLVFLGNYAWQTFGSHLGPAGRLSLLSLASAGLVATGAWMYRRQESLRLYAQVLMGGGAALAYYATYAAHFVARLRVIESPLIGGALLLACGAGLLAFADRRRWELAALITIVLSYYTAGINPIGEFTLYSNLLLTLAGIVLLVRRQWTTATWVTLAGTYGSYAFWHFYRHAGSGLRAEEPWVAGITFLTCYWSFFTAAVFLAQAESFPAGRRATFLTLNNAGFFLLAAHHLLARRSDVLWAFCLVSGSVLLALAVAAWKWRRDEPALDGAFLFQGVALVTIGLAQKLAGPQLALTLAVESLLLLTGAGRRHGLLYTMMASVIAGWAFVLGATEIPVLPVGFTLSGLLIADAWWLKQRRGELARLSRQSPRGMVRRFGFAHGRAGAGRPLPVCAGTDFLRCGCGDLHRVDLRTAPSRGCLGRAALSDVRRRPLLGGSQAGQPWWLVWPVVASALALAHWWQWQRILPLHETASRVVQLIAAGMLVLAGYAWTEPHLTGDAWLAALSAAAAGTLVYGRATRSWSIAVCGQLFALAALVVFAQSLSHPGARWPAGLTPACALLAGFFLLPPVISPGGNTAAIAKAYWWAALALVVVWAFQYLPAPWQPLFFAATLRAAARARRVAKTSAVRRRQRSVCAHDLRGVCLRYSSRPWSALPRRHPDRARSHETFAPPCTGARRGGKAGAQRDLRSRGRKPLALGHALVRLARVPAQPHGSVVSHRAGGPRRRARAAGAGLSGWRLPDSGAGDRADFPRGCLATRDAVSHPQLSLARRRAAAPRLSVQPVLRANQALAVRFCRWPLRGRGTAATQHMRGFLVNSRALRPETADCPAGRRPEPARAARPRLHPPFPSASSAGAPRNVPSHA